MLKMVEAYHPADNTPLFIMLKIEGQQGHIESESPNDDFIVWPEEMVDEFQRIANEMQVGEVSSYNMCVDDCIFCDTLRERLQQQT